MQTKIWNITKIINWYPFKSSEFNSDWKGLLIIRIQDMEKWINNNSKFWNWSYDEKVLINKWDILVSLSWSFKIEKWNFEAALLNQRIIKIESSNENNLLTWYLYYYLTQKLDEIKSKATNTSIPNISVNDVKNLQIPLPLLHTQKQIIQKLDTLTNMINLRKLSIEKTEKLTKSIFIEMFWDPMINEKGWEVKKLEELCNKITDWTHNSPKTFTVWYPYISAKHIKTYWIDLSDLQYVKEEEHKKIYSRCNPEKWDVLYIKDWATTWIAQVNNLNFEFTMLSSLALFKLNKELLNEYYLTYFLNNESVYKDLIRWMWWAAIKRFTLEKIKVFKIFLPPISLQNKFASIVEKNEENIKKQKESLRKLEELYASVMQESFGV